MSYRLSKDGTLIGEYGSEAEAIEMREALCGLNHRDDFLIVEMRQIKSQVPASLEAWMDENGKEIIGRPE